MSREKAELYLPDLYNKIGVGLMAWSPGFMESQSVSDRLIKGSFTKKSQSYSSWTEDEGNKDVRLFPIIHGSSALSVMLNKFTSRAGQRTTDQHQRTK